MEKKFCSRCNSYINSKFDKMRGCFVLSLEVIYSNPLIVMDIMSHMIIWEAKRDWVKDTIEYFAKSYLFDPLEEGEETPWYIIEYDEKSRKVIARRKNGTKETERN